MKRRASTVTVAEEVWAPVKATILELKEQVGYIRCAFLFFFVPGLSRHLGSQV